MSTVVAVSGLLISSTGSALLRKVLFQLNGYGLDGTVHTFEKPCEEGATANGYKEVDLPAKAQGVTWAQLHVLLYPGIANVVSILVQGAGLRFITASVSQMLSGSCILFTAGLSVIVLRAKLNMLHYVGITLACVGVTVVSLVTLLAREEAATTDVRSTAIGIGLTLVAMAILAVRLVLEELLLDSMVLHPMQVLGFEGAWGSVFMAVLGLPLAWLLPGHDIGGHEENTLDSVAMLWNTGSLNATNLLFFWSVVGLNVFGLMVTQTLGSVFRAVLLTTRTASVWAVNLALYSLHVGGSSRVGEPWSSPESWVQMAGFVLLLAGTIVYAQGSSPAIDDLAAKEADGDEAAGAALLAESPLEGSPEGGPQEGPQIGRNIAQYRPYYSVYVPRTAARAIRPRSTSAERMSMRHCSSLPSEGWLGAQLALGPTRNASMPDGVLPWRRRASHPPLEPPAWQTPQRGGPAQDGGPSDAPFGTSPAFVRTLLSRKSWFLDPDATEGSSPSTASAARSPGEAVGAASGGASAVIPMRRRRSSMEGGSLGEAGDPEEGPVTPEPPLRHQASVECARERARTAESAAESAGKGREAHATTQKEPVKEAQEILTGI
ncbi:hypothetical protein WJX81_007423 [Elliptochloris bilobata]|uniref:EamA domain-containing protein n=1 Tax=Elliptochloris bilobata TaxID=381761 RepID=A0AAW1R4B7_9CHLO